MPRRAFEPIYPNPYIAGNPIRDQEMFFGRVDEFRFIARALEDGRKPALIVLFGERRSGKSSILYQILNGRLGEAFLPIFVDMQIMAGIAGDADFFERIIADACKQLAGNGLSAEPYAAQLKETAATNVFRRFLQEVKSRFPNRAPLLLVDEYENLEARVKEGSLSQHILTFFAGLLETDLVSFVFTGSRSLEVHDQTIWGEELFRKATSRKISFLTKDDTTRLITQPLQNKVDFAPEVVAQIYALTAGQPFYTQMICQNLVYHLNEVQKSQVTPEDLEIVVDGVLENPPPQLIFNWSEHTSERKLALSLLAEFSEAPQTFLSASDLCRGIKRKKLELDLAPNFFHAELSSLFQDEHVLQKGRKHGFRLDLYRLWLRRDHNIWQVKKEIEQEEIDRITRGPRPKKEILKKGLRAMEHGLLLAAIVAVATLLWQLYQNLQKHVMVQANGGPFKVIVDGEEVGSTQGRSDSTRFELPKKFLKGRTHAFKAILLANGEVWSDSVTIMKDDQIVSCGFSVYPAKIITNTASLRAKLGGEKIETFENQPLSWACEFRVCAGNYMIEVEDRKTEKKQSRKIMVRDTSNSIVIDFDHIAILTLKANQFPFGYEYQRHQGKRGIGFSPDSVVVLRGFLKGPYHFKFTIPGTSQSQSRDYRITANQEIRVKFALNSKSIKPPKEPHKQTPVPGVLQISTDPEGAVITLDGRVMGQTSRSINLEPRNYTLKLEKNGYDDIEKVIPLKSDTTKVHEILVPQFAFLKIKVNDGDGAPVPDAEVYLDEKFSGKTPGVGIQWSRVRVGYLKIEVRHEDFITATKYVYLGKGAYEEAKITLEEK